MRRRWLLALALCCVASGSAAATLENDAIRLDVSDQNGAIVGLVHLPSGTEFVTDPAQARLFQLMLSPIGERTRRILSWQQQAAVGRISDSELEIRYERLQPEQEQYIFGSGVIHFPEAVLGIEARVRLRLDGEHVVARLELDNRGHEVVTGAIFPRLGGLPLQQGESAARIVLPSQGQRTFTHTIGAFTGERTQRYPALLASAWLSYELGAASVGIDARGGFESQDALFGLNPGHFETGSAYRGRYEWPVLGWISWPHVAAGENWSSPEIWIHLHGADWHQVAAEHREWYRAEHRPAGQDGWAGHTGFATYRLKRDDNTIDWQYADLERLAAEAAQAGMTRMVVEGWRELEGPRNAAPFGEVADPRMGGGEALREAAARLSRRGIDLILAFHPTLINVFADAYPSPHESWTVRSSLDAAQIPVDFLATTSDYPAGAMSNRFQMEIDPATPATDFLLEAAERIRDDYGIGSLLLKGVGQRSFLSYNRLHGLAPQSAFATGYERLLGGLRERFADGILLAEGFNDLVNGYTAAAYTWDQGHDAAILPYSVPWSLLSNDVEALDYRAANASFAHRALINLVVDGGRGTVAPYEDFAAHLGELKRLKGAAPDCYASAEYRDRDGLSDVVASGEVAVSVFVSVSGDREDVTAGIVLANLAGEPATVSFTLDYADAGRRSRFYRAGQQAPDTRAPGPRVAAELPPFGVSMLCFGS